MIRGESVGNPEIEEAALNEVVYTHVSEVISVKDVVRSCNTRLFISEAKLQCRIPSQCRHGGTGDLFCVKHHLAWPISIKKGWNPADDEIQASP